MENVVATLSDFILTLTQIQLTPELCLCALPVTIRCSHKLKEFSYCKKCEGLNKNARKKHIS